MHTSFNVNSKMEKRIEWSYEKNEWLKKIRNLSFEAVEIAIQQGENENH